MLYSISITSYLQRCFQGAAITFFCRDLSGSCPESSLSQQESFAATQRQGLLHALTKAQEDRRTEGSVMGRIWLARGLC